MAKRNKMPGNMNNMMKQVQKMQRDMEAKQKEIESSTFQATAGGGAITVEVSGKKEVLNIELDEDIVDPDDIEMLQYLIVAAVNEALRQADEAMAKGMGQFTGGLNIPGLM